MTASADDMAWVLAKMLSSAQEHLLPVQLGVGAQGGTEAVLYSGKAYMRAQAYMRGGCEDARWVRMRVRAVASWTRSR